MPQGRPLFMFRTHFSAPRELIVIELIYFLFVVGLSLFIYLKTKEVYQLTKHKGIYYFRKIFFYFSLAYTFRLINIIVIFSRELLGFFSPMRFGLGTILLVSYFSTLAILSLFVSLNIKNIKIEESNLESYMHIFAVLISVLVIFVRSYYLLIVIQIITFIIAILLTIFVSRKQKYPKFISKNIVTYALLILFWVINTLAFTRNLLPREIMIPVYVLSVSVFFSIFLRIKKRLRFI
ncbi:hypothetical protein GF327_05000 [Candidatus Woesearchaeota archaeon]|nr:hypothetical protein [Candidatus Woesearchaeota archaeon]